MALLLLSTQKKHPIMLGPLLVHQKLDFPAFHLSFEPSLNQVFKSLWREWSSNQGQSFL